MCDNTGVVRSVSFSPEKHQELQRVVDSPTKTCTISTFVTQKRKFPDTKSTSPLEIKLTKKTKVSPCDVPIDYQSAATKIVHAENIHDISSIESNNIVSVQGKIAKIIKDCHTVPMGSKQLKQKLVVLQDMTADIKLTLWEEATTAELGKSYAFTAVRVKDAYPGKCLNTTKDTTVNSIDDLTDLPELSAQYADISVTGKIVGCENINQKYLCRRCNFHIPISDDCPKILHCTRCEMSFPRHLCAFKMTTSLLISTDSADKLIYVDTDILMKLLNVSSEEFQSNTPEDILTKVLCIVEPVTFHCDRELTALHL
ncbi:uncharacterized protein [Ptychodera flava]|uniref:uncharacterized protein n=1 Tax=Ptychodera flava TaxID=63121 RepID=UPI00396A5143